jgi:hypothetical protein
VIEDVVDVAQWGSVVSHPCRLEAIACPLQRP